MTVAFAREAANVLRDGGYELERKTGKEHTVWRHRTDAVPKIHVPGTPRDADYALVRIRRAVEQGTTPHIPAGSINVTRRPTTPMAKRGQNHSVPLKDRLVKLASPAITRRAAAKKAGEPFENLDREVVAAWMRRCIETHGAIPGSIIREAAEELELTITQLTKARKDVGAVGYRRAGHAHNTDETYTDFAKRVPADALVLGAPGVKRGPRKNAVTTTNVTPEAPPEPKDPDQGGGRRLDMGDLTPEQHAEAERMMRESTERADAEAAERRRLREELAEREQSAARAIVAAEGEHVNGNGRRSQLDAAMDLLREAALADTHALTDEDIAMLRGHQDTLKRLRGDLDGMSASIGRILTRVDTRETAGA